MNAKFVLLAFATIVYQANGQFPFGNLGGFGGNGGGLFGLPNFLNLFGGNRPGGFIQNWMQALSPQPQYKPPSFLPFFDRPSAPRPPPPPFISPELLLQIIQQQQQQQRPPVIVEQPIYIPEPQISQPYEPTVLHEGDHYPEVGLEEGEEEQEIIPEEEEEETAEEFEPVFEEEPVEEVHVPGFEEEPEVDVNAQIPEISNNVVVDLGEMEEEEEFIPEEEEFIPEEEEFIPEEEDIPQEEDILQEEDIPQEEEIDNEIEIDINAPQISPAVEEAEVVHQAPLSVDPQIAEGDLPEEFIR